jgi:hypothetical protein
LVRGGGRNFYGQRCLQEVEITGQQESAFKLIWKSPAPSKVMGFAWLMLRDRVPTRENLIRRRVLIDDGEQRCVFCGSCAETVPHLFLYCNFTLQVWNCVLSWLGLKLILPHSIVSPLNYIASSPGLKRKRRGLVMIWNAVIWILWWHRNKVIFDNGVIDVASLVDDVKSLSWRWSVGRSDSAPSLLYEWIAEPVICLSNG